MIFSGMKSDKLGFMQTLLVFERTTEMKESEFQRKLIKKIQKMFPGCEVHKQDAFQGIPDLLILYGKHWAMLECKRDEATYKRESGKQPNQVYYVNHFNQMSFASFIYPENEEEVLNELSKIFGDGT